MQLKVPGGRKEYPVVAILSSTVLPIDGDYRRREITFPGNLEGVQHYVGHPATKELVEALGATRAESNLFGGLEVGEACLCVPLAKPRDDGKSEWTNHAAVESTKDLKAILVIRTK